VATKERLVAMAGLPSRRVLGSDGAKLREGEPNQQRIGVPHLCVQGVRPQSNLQRRRRRQLMGNDGQLLLGAIGSPIRA
jgi:hypothetical protein